MANSNVPVRIPERQPEPSESAHSRPVTWHPEKKPGRLVIKVAGSIPF
jgi:hypothetical protein